jgi:hypothetical protein
MKSHTDRCGAGNGTRKTMSYFSAEDPELKSSLGCGPECNCGPCRSGISGLNERYEKEEEDEPKTTTQGIPIHYQTAAPATRLNGYNWFRSSFGYYADDDKPATAEAEPPAEADHQPTEPEQKPVATEQRPTGTESRPVIDESILRDAIGHRIRSPKRLTDILFFARHADLKGSTTWANDAALLDEWHQIKNDIVIPELRRSVAPRYRPVVRRRIRHPRLHGFPKFGLGYFAAPPVCETARRDLAAVATDLTLINNELARGPGLSPARLSLKRQLLDSDVNGMIGALDSYIASGCCEPALKTLETEIQALPWPIIVVPTRLRLLREVLAAQGRARKDTQHC